MNSTLGSPRADETDPTDSGNLLSEKNPVPLSRDPFLVGEILAGKYRVERLIGEGAMGVVLAATHLELDETVAIKFIRPEVQETPGVVGRFAREAKALVRIKGEHAVKVLDVGIIPTRGPYIVMEYVEGTDLANLLADKGPLPARRAVEYLMQACEALASAHANGITHRDIKPENLFLTRSGDLEVIKVLDFGISKAALVGRVLGGDLSMVRTSYLMGTPLYMSPEQVRGTKDIDHRSDIWSLGVVLYELLTGNNAFMADSMTQVCANVLEEQPPPLPGHSPGAPELWAVIQRCLQKNPANRFQNVAELAAALRPFAPSRVWPYVERCAAILRGAGIDVQVGVSDSNLPAASETATTLSLRRIPTQNSARLLPLLEAGQPELAELAVAPVRKRGKWAVLAAVFLLASGLGLWFTRTTERPPTTSAARLPEPAAAPSAPPAARAVELPKKPDEPPPEPTVAREANPPSRPRPAPAAPPARQQSAHGRARQAPPSRQSAATPNNASAPSGVQNPPPPIVTEENKQRARIVEEPKRAPILD